jgi:guanyl-specific ribonuclease Sa
MRYLLILVLAVAGLLWWNGSCKQAPAPPPNRPASAAMSDHAQAPEQQQAPSKRTAANVPAYVLEVLDYVKQHHRAPEGLVGGRTFENREHRLPASDDRGAAIRYQEWDVHEKVQGQNRGAERLITGSDQSARYTKDHYKTFTRIE